MSKRPARVGAWFLIAACVVFRQAIADPSEWRTYPDVKSALTAEEADFNIIPLGNAFDPTAKGYAFQQNIVAGPGIRVPQYIRGYETPETPVGMVVIGLFKGKVAMKMQMVFLADKTTCMEQAVRTVEVYQSRGVRNWRKIWREDYQVPHWKAEFRGVALGVTCRSREGVWLIEDRHAIPGFNTKF